RGTEATEETGSTRRNGETETNGEDSSSTGVAKRRVRVDRVAKMNTRSIHGVLILAIRSTHTGRPAVPADPSNPPLVSVPPFLRVDPVSSVTSVASLRRADVTT